MVSRTSFQRLARRLNFPWMSTAQDAALDAATAVDRHPAVWLNGGLLRPDGSLADIAAQSPALEALSSAQQAVLQSGGGLVVADALGALTGPGGPISTGGAGAVDEAVIDTTGVSSTAGDIGPVLSAAVAAADRGPGIAPNPIRLKPGRYRLRTNLMLQNKSVDLRADGAIIVQDPLQSVGSADLNVASTAGWPTSGTLTTYSTTDGKTFVTQNLSYTGVATSPTRFTGVTGWTGSTGTIMQGELVTNGAQITTANAASSVLSGDGIKITLDLGTPIAVSGVGGVVQSGAIPELYVSTTAAFASSGTLTVNRTDGTTAAVTYTGKTAYSFTGCAGMSGAVAAGAVITDGTNTAYAIQTKYGWAGDTGPIVTINGAQAANAGTLNIVNATALPSSGGIRVLSAAGAEVITYTGKTSTTLTGCTGGSASTIADGAVAAFEGSTAAGNRESYGTRAYCSTAGLAVGDVVKLFSNDILNVAAFNAYGSDTVEMQAEMARIALVNAAEGYVVLDRELYLTYLTSIRMVRMDNTRTCRVRGLTTEYVNRAVKVGVNLGGYRGAIYVEGYVEPDLDMIGAQSFPGPNLSVRNCYSPKIGTVWGKHQCGDTSLNQVGYTLNLEAVTGGSARVLIGERVRHIVTSNANNNARGVDTDARNYGGVVDFHVETTIGINNESFAWDTHTDAIAMTGGRVIVRNDFQPRSEQMGAVQFRGYFGCGVDHIHYDGPGYALLVQGDIGAVDFRVGRITGRHQFTYRGGAGTTARQTTTASGAQTLPSATFNVASVSYLSPAGGTVLVHTSDNGPQSVAYTGITGTQLTGCTGGSGTVASGALVVQVTNPEARLRIDSIDVTPTGGTNILRHTRNGLLDIGDLRVRFGPASFRPQNNLACNVMSFVNASDPDNGRLRIGSMHIDLTAYPSAAAQSVAIYALALDTSSASQNYKYRSVQVDRLTIDFGGGYGSGPGNKFGIVGGTGQSRDGDVIGELIVRQSSVAAGSFNPQFWASGALNKSIKVRGTIYGSGGTLAELGDNAQSFSSAAQALYHAGPNYYLASNTLGIAAPMRARLTVTNAAGKVTNLQPPSYDGQVWRIACAVASANPVVIAAGQISNVGGDLSIAAANEVTLTASGGSWVKFTAA